MADKFHFDTIHRNNLNSDLIFALPNRESNRYTTLSPLPILNQTTLKRATYFWVYQKRGKEND